MYRGWVLPWYRVALLYCLRYLILPLCHAPLYGIIPEMSDPSCLVAQMSHHSYMVTNYNRLNSYWPTLIIRDPDNTGTSLWLPDCRARDFERGRPVDPAVLTRSIL